MNENVTWMIEKRATFCSAGGGDRSFLTRRLRPPVRCPPPPPPTPRICCCRCLLCTRRLHHNTGTTATSAATAAATAMLGEAAEKVAAPSTKPKAVASTPVERVQPTGGRQAQAQALKAAGRPIPGRGRGRGRGRPRRRRTKSNQVYVSAVLSLSSLIRRRSFWHSVPCRAIPWTCIFWYRCLVRLKHLKHLKHLPGARRKQRAPTSLNQTRPIKPKRHKHLPTQQFVLCCCWQWWLFFRLWVCCWCFLEVCVRVRLVSETRGVGESILACLKRLSRLRCRHFGRRCATYATAVAL